MKLKSILYLLIALPLLWSCNNEDNIEDIFSSGTWYLINFYGGGLDDAGTPEFTPKDDNATLEVIQKFTIVFNMTIHSRLRHKISPLKAFGKKKKKTVR